jgi:hypothetical protein
MLNAVATLYDVMAMILAPAAPARKRKGMNPAFAKHESSRGEAQASGM